MVEAGTKGGGIDVGGVAMVVVGFGTALAGRLGFAIYII